MASIPKLAIPAPRPRPRAAERSVPVSARTRIATAGRVSALARVYEPKADRADRANRADTDSESEEEVEEQEFQNVQVKATLPALPCVREDELFSQRSQDGHGQEAPPSFRDTERSESQLASVRSDVPRSEPPSERSDVANSEASTRLSRHSESKALHCAGAAGLGAMAGSTAGAFLGFFSGLVPAPLTLGLSVPINTGLGSVGGLVLGGAGGLLGQSMEVLEIEPLSEVGSGARAVLLKLSPGPEEPVMSCALKGGLAIGSLGGASGSAIGGLAGAAVGLPSAILTLGLSVPVCAALGSGVGLCIGSLAGGSVGILGGSLLGHLNSRAAAAKATA